MATMEGGSKLGPLAAVCSVCTLPLIGRQPKLLPCFHTFCLPCLTSLAKETTAVEESGVGDVQSKVCLATITCPTCCKIIPVPTSGVASFQANNSLTEAGYQQTPNTSAVCSLCREARAASCLCVECLRTFCPCCLQFHDRLTKNHHLQPLPMVAANNARGNGLDGHDQVETTDGMLVSLADTKPEMQPLSRCVDDVGPCCGTQPGRDVFRECLVGVGSALQAACDNLLAQTKASPAMPAALVHLSQGKEFASNAVLGRGNPSMAINNFSLQCSVDLSGNPAEPSPLLSAKPNLLSKDVAKRQVTDHQIHNNLASIDVIADCTQLSVTGFSEDMRIGNASLMASVSGITEGLQAQLDSVLEKIAFLENRVHMLEADNASLRHTYLAMSRDVATVRDKNVLLCQNVGLLLTENAKFNRELSKVHQDFKAETATLQQEFLAQSSRLCNEMGVVQTFFKGYQDLQRHPRAAELPDVMGSGGILMKQVAFNAWLKESVTTTVEQTLVISKVTLNVGDGYNPHTGIFTAPVSGTYLFIFTIWSGTSQNRSGVFIVLENEVIGGACTANENSCTGYSVAHVGAGQKVWLRTLGGEEISIECGSTFGGLLIQAEL